MKKSITMKQLVFSILITILIIISLFLTYQVIAVPNIEPVESALSLDVLSYQGTLLDNSGNPVNGDKDMTFKIFNHPTDPTALWEEVHLGDNAVPVQNGLFNVMLGSLSPIPDSLWYEAELYLSIKIGSDDEMTPRELLTTVPGAASANVAQTALSVANGAVGSNGFAPTWYESFNSTSLNNPTSSWMPTENVVEFVCEVDCVVFIMHRGLVRHDDVDGWVNVAVRIDGAAKIHEKCHPAGANGPISGQGIFPLDKGTHIVEVYFATNGATPGISTYYGDPTGKWDHLYVMVFAQH